MGFLWLVTIIQGALHPVHIHRKLRVVALLEALALDPGEGAPRSCAARGLPVWPRTAPARSPLHAGVSGLVSE